MSPALPNRGTLPPAPGTLPLPRARSRGRGRESRAAYPVLQLRGELGLELAARAAAVVSLNEHLPGHRRLLRPHGEDRTRRSASSGKTRGQMAGLEPALRPASPSEPPTAQRRPRPPPSPIPFVHGCRRGLPSYPSPGPAPPHILVRPWKHKPASSALQQLSRHLRRRLRPVAKKPSLSEHILRHPLTPRPLRP